VRYCPRHTGARFSAKARAPSRASSDERTTSEIGACSSNADSAGQSRDSRLIRLLARSASGAFAAMVAASSSAASTAVPADTSRYADARVSRVYGGTSEVMRSIIAKSMGL
jgi:alkylation response protein AidB-like acyl-CoA dehydrogenase